MTAFSQAKDAARRRFRTGDVKGRLSIGSYDGFHHFTITCRSNKIIPNSKISKEMCKQGMITLDELNKYQIHRPGEDVG
ncbi:MAG: hypothetical protein L6243_01770 [Candidatus Altiarchaeales archaeon]|nr:hypothetical protein [Candidatus Altiarchaeota archaeon]MBU4341851.1 hypothetical protein [Candidatus Altiarchaeota archaeon]MCG2782297.1 hypothetical protein [Candidatus Altiarchaeales archaeon]